MRTRGIEGLNWVLIQNPRCIINRDISTANLQIAHKYNDTSQLEQEIKIRGC